MFYQDICKKSSLFVLFIKQVNVLINYVLITNL